MVRLSKSVDIQKRHRQVTRVCSAAKMSANTGGQWRIQGAGVGHGPPRHVGHAPRALRHRPKSNPPLVFLCINHNVVSNTLVLWPIAICMHTTASFPTSNGFLRLKKFKQ